MKKIIFLLFILTFILKVNAQKNHNDSVGKIKVKIGFMFNPQGRVDLKKPTYGFKATTPFLTFVSMEKGFFSLTPIYILTDNSAGMFIEYKSKLYLVGVKNTKSSNSYLGLGFNIPILNWNNKVNAFIELGTSYNKFDPGVLVGICIPFILKQ